MSSVAGLSHSGSFRSRNRETNSRVWTPAPKSLQPAEGGEGAKRGQRRLNESLRRLAERLGLIDPAAEDELAVPSPRSHARIQPGLSPYSGPISNRNRTQRREIAIVLKQCRT
jgi:hypothetical protein